MRPKTVLVGPTLASVAIILAAAAAQVLLFRHYFQREIAWTYVLRGDTNWYVWHIYTITEAIRAGDWARIWSYCTTFPWGMPLLFQAAAIQLVHGTSRAGAAFLNLAYFLIAQAATFVVFRRIGGSVWSGIAAVALLLAMQTPFRGDGPGLNIADFHFDLVFFYFLLGIFYLVAWSDTFARLGPSLAVAALAALAVASRLVGVFLIIGIFGALFLLLVCWWRGSPRDREKHRQRLVNLVWAALAFVLLSSIPVVIAAEALYHHYFRFVFDLEFRTTREGLYSMAPGIAGDAWQLLRRMLTFDFGWAFAGALGLLLGTAVLGRAVPAVPAPAEPGLARLGQPGEPRRSYIGFLLLAALVSYAMHLVFPIKSDHLTRMTAAPLLVLIAVLAAPLITRAVAGRRVAAVVLLSAIAAVGAGVQLHFYLSPSRFAGQRADLEEVNRLYADMSRVVEKRGQAAVALSTDRIGEFELGPFIGFIIREYERRGVLLQLHRRLGAHIDQPISKANALVQIAQSDFVLLQEGSYGGSPWPFMKSVAGFHDGLAAHVAAHHCLLGRYRMWGQEKALYVRPTYWTVAASASTQAIYGPQALFGPGGTIWHAPWPAGARGQWVSFETRQPVRLAAIALTAQDGAPRRAPRDFRIEAIAEDGTARLLLTVTGADFAGQQTRRFELPAAEPSRRYRLTVSANNGDPGLLTIQDAQAEVADRICPNLD